MKRRLPIVLAAIVFAYATQAATDVEVSAAIEYAYSNLCDTDYAERRQNDAMQLCEGDTNRFVRLMCGLVGLTDNKIQNANLILGIGDMGGLAQIPFLQSKISDPQLGECAVESILRIEGVTSNSIAIVDSYLSMTNQSCAERVESCRLLMKMSHELHVTNDVTSAVYECATKYASTCPMCFSWLDRGILNAFPEYRFSKRRLAIFRGAVAHGVDQWDIGYVTNAINELVTYPESALGE